MRMKKLLIRFLYGMVLLLCIAATAGISVLLESKQFAFKEAVSEPKEASMIDPFPVGVDPENQLIIEDQLVDAYAYETLALKEAIPDTWRAKVAAFFAKREWYQNLASPVSRILVIWPGERKEEVAKNIGDILRWDAASRTEFIHLIASNEPVLAEGKFFPGQYVAHRDAQPEEVAGMITSKFKDDILSRYTTDVAAKVPLEDALVIASLLEREASDFENMREVSGVIWNRLFINMPLQLDATLQYARGSKVTEKNWWPAPKPSDKFLDSPFNTYANKGLPPGAISNPSAAAVLAALNPRATDCLYYFHADNQDYYCSDTYEEHVQKLKSLYGQGR